MQFIGQHLLGSVRAPAIALIAMFTLAGSPIALAQVCPFDDGNSSLEVEGLILTRYALGVTGAPLVASTGINAVDAPSVEATINCPSCGLNITGNPTMTVADATIISRKLAGFSGAALTDGLALGGGTRNTPGAVASFLLGGCGAIAATRLLPEACATNQIAAWNGSAWVCTAPPPALPASCLDGQLLKLQAGAIVCSAAPQTFTTVDSVGSVGRHTAIAKSLDGQPVISYFDLTNSSVKVVKCGNAACSGGNIVTTVDNSGSLGRYTSIAVPADGFPIISYSSSNSIVETTASALKVAKCVDVSCSGAAILTVVDATAAAVGRHSSIAISQDGFPVISYYDGTNGSLKVAKCVSATCAGATITTLDGSGATDVGQFTSIAVPADGLPVISYFDVTNFDLKFVKCSVANCSVFSTPVTVDGIGVGNNVGKNTSIAISADATPIIAYYSSSAFAIKLVKCINIVCTGATVVTSADIGFAVDGKQSIAVPADGRPVMSYRRNTGLMVIKCGNAACSSGNVLSSVDLDGISGAAIMVPASDGLPVIAYDDGFDGNLKVVKCSNSGCANP